MLPNKREQARGDNHDTGNGKKRLNCEGKLKRRKREQEKAKKEIT